MSSEDDRLRIRLAEIMSSAGVGYNQLALEILYLLPTEFVTQYEVLFKDAYGELGSGDKRGRQADRQALINMASTGSGKGRTGSKGKLPGAGAGGMAKRYTRIFDIKNEKALELKVRLDKRLRAMAREIRLTRQEGNWGRGMGMGMGDNRGGSRGFDSGSQSHSKSHYCKKCGRIASAEWQFCPYDGAGIINKILED